MINNKETVQKYTSVNLLRGFLMIEVITVLAITVLIASMALALGGEMRRRADLDGAETTLVHSIETARTRAISGVGTEDHGIHVSSDAVTTFRGSVFDPLRSDNTTHLLTGSVILSSSESTIVFKRVRGTPSAPSSFMITHSGGDTRTVLVDEAGGIR